MPEPTVTTLSIALCHLVLHGTFTWARFAIFRIDGATPVGVRIIEVSATASTVAGLVLITFRSPGPAILDALALLIAAASAALFTWGLRTIRTGQLTAAFSPDQPTHLL